MKTTGRATAILSDSPGELQRRPRYEAARMRNGRKHASLRECFATHPESTRPRTYTPQVLFGSVG